MRRIILYSENTHQRIHDRCILLALSQRHTSKYLHDVRVVDVLQDFAFVLENGTLYMRKYLSAEICEERYIGGRGNNNR